MVSERQLHLDIFPAAVLRIKFQPSDLSRQSHISSVFKCTNPISVNFDYSVVLKLLRFQWGYANLIGAQCWVDYTSCFRTCLITSAHTYIMFYKLLSSVAYYLSYSVTHYISITCNVCNIHTCIILVLYNTPHNISLHLYYLFTSEKSELKSLIMLYSVYSFKSKYIFPCSYCRS